MMRSRSPLANIAVTARARTVGSGSDAAPIKALICDGRQRDWLDASASMPTAATSANDVWLFASALALPAVPSASCSMNSTALARTSMPCDRSTASRARSRQYRGIAGAGAVHRVGKLADAAAPLAVAPPLIHLPRRPFGRSIVVAGRAGIGHAERHGRLGHRRLERVIAAPDQQPPVHVAHMAADAPAARRRRTVKRMRLDRRIRPRDGGIASRAGGLRQSTRCVALRAQEIPVPPLRDVQLQRERVPRSVCHVTVGAGDLAGLEAAADASAPAAG